MNGAACEEKTPEPVTLSGERKQSVQKNDIQIPGVQLVDIEYCGWTMEDM